MHSQLYWINNVLTRSLMIFRMDFQSRVFRTLFPSDSWGYNVPDSTDVVNMWSINSSAVIFSAFWLRIVFTAVV